MRIRPQSWMKRPATRALLAALKGEARFVGGCVRDALLKRPIGDIDLATPLFPDEVMRRLAAAGIKVVPTGLAHGTVTALIERHPFEITTLRRDVETFGRHANVAFTSNWAEDSRRRDFTMNALYLAADGEIFDYQEGLRDLRRGKVRFVGDPATRIREDVLRVLRFYRFHAWLGRGAADAAARAACRVSAPLVSTLSGERVQAELMKLLRAADPAATLALMAEDGVLGKILPATRPLDILRRLVRLERSNDLEADALRRLGAVIAGDAEGVARRLKLSNAERDRLIALEGALDLAGDAPAQRRLLYRLGRETYIDRALMTAAQAGATRKLRGLLAAAARWRKPVFPLSGGDVTALGLAPGPEIGRLLAALEDWWEEGDFRASRRACLAELRRRVLAVVA
ncbi:MAG TPA: CCA tRNA nucleotidyltransferase [Stellaceae bacterium]|nr:CCA tRNA nucleotidyltransferase [Stellaceae bacterium]